MTRWQRMLARRELARLNAEHDARRKLRIQALEDEALLGQLEIARDRDRWERGLVFHGAATDDEPKPAHVPSWSPPDDAVKQFRVLSQSWYGGAPPFRGERPEVLDVITLGYYCQDGGCYAEMQISLVKLGPGTTAVIKVYDDAWRALANMPELIALLDEASTEGMGIPPRGVDWWGQKLKAAGYADATEREDPRD